MRDKNAKTLINYPLINEMKENATKATPYELYEADYEDDGKDFDLDHCALRIVSGAACASREEILASVKYLQTKIIGTGYYDGEGDELLQHIVNYLLKKAGEE